uniref:Uncharacterized protein n=1 Tax=Siphoviridae sp. ctQWe10 TaxID=2827867 RepID=A0A8S5TBL4_9CAUD|nr:MAG TPA: hypothetical protein [Siphoviridae sp. ctQWe10]
MLFCRSKIKNELGKCNTRLVRTDRITIIIRLI